MTNLEAVLTAACATFTDVLKKTSFLIDIGDFTTVNPIYGERFASSVAPVRSTVAVSMLPLGARVLIEAIAPRRLTYAHGARTRPNNSRAR